MRPKIPALAATICSLFLITNSSAEEKKWIQLFDGESFEGWVNGAGKPVSKGWTVKDGTINWTEKGGSIYSVDSFKDFELVVEWKIAPGTNSGIKYRFEEGIGPEYQLIDDVNGGDLKPQHLTGDLYDVISSAEGKPLNAPGEWNTTRIKAKGNHLEHWLNGVKLLEVQLDSEEWEDAVTNSKFKGKDWFGRNAGPIMLQDHGGEVSFQKVQIRHL